MGEGRGLPCPSRKSVTVQRTGVLELRRLIPKRGGTQRGRGVGHGMEAQGGKGHCSL